ncbi:MAG: hypothetical protein KKG60_02840 [Nanoarchaeota archaeon]|nr:hypothetical protein [Nanoarchaeota archaeon]
MVSWRENVDPLIKEHLEAQIRETTKNQSTYMQADEPALAQLWVSIANLSKQLFNLNLKIKYMEKLVKDTLERSREVPKEESVSLVFNSKPEKNSKPEEGFKKIRIGDKTLIGQMEMTPGYLHWVDAQGGVWEMPPKRRGERKGSRTRIGEVDIEQGTLHWVDAQGRIWEMSPKRRKKGVKNKKKVIKVVSKKKIAKKKKPVKKKITRKKQKKKR